MMKGRKFIYIFVFLLCFLFTQNVNAATTCEYGIQCKYALDGLRDSVGGGHYMGGGYLYVVFQCEDNSKTYSECSRFTVKAAASKQDMSGNALHETGGNPGEEIEITDNSDIIPSNVNDYKSYFSNNDRFVCPTLYYLGSGGLRVKFQKFGEGMNRISWTAEPLSGTTCIDKDESVDEDAMQDQATEDAGHAHADSASGKNDEKDDGIDEGIIQSILDWAGLESSTRYELNEVDPCAIISGDIQRLLHTVFLFISVAGIIILIVMTIISVVKVITASEDKALSNFLKGLWKRIICLIILLLLPVIVTFLIQVVNGAGAIWGVNSDNPLCNITE